MPIDLLAKIQTVAAPPLDPRSTPPVACEALYVHIPFCFHKCHYCDFYSITRQTPERMSRYVDLVLRELDIWTLAGRAPIPETIFFGGGTPSLLPIEQMRRLIVGLRARLDLSRLGEWTIECNPATVSPEYAAMLREAGIDRLSFGAQSFDRAELQTLERHHDPDDVIKSLELAKRAGFERLSIDLIFAIPNQSMESWLRTLQTALSLGLSHLSAYALTYEENTPIAVRKRLGSLVPAEESLELQMLRETRRRLADAGMPAYEISNFAAPGQECRHNLMYWRGGNYVGIGPSAASHVAGKRFKNRPHLGEWEAAVEAGNLPATDVETLTPRQRVGELAMSLLRLREGAEYSRIDRITNLDSTALFAETVAHLSKLNLIASTCEGFALTEDGIAVADAIAGEFVVAEF